jgi:methylenetetrahydrofolate reductase (NADPH)
MNGAASFSVEFFPPKDESGEARLWASLCELAQYRPDFVSVTYGAGGSTRDRTVRVTSEITKRTGLPTVAHLTCVGASEIELKKTLESYREAGISSILALRGDPDGGPSAPWQSAAGGFDHADQLVTLAKSMGFDVGVAAFPDKHPSSPSKARDIEVLLEKERRGASFATTQFFFSPESYFNLVASLRDSGSRLPIIAGLLPITNVKQLERMATLGGTPIPDSVQRKIIAVQEDPNEVRRIGVEIAVELGRKLLEGGAPGLHFYTMNSATSTIEVIRRIGLR